MNDDFLHRLRRQPPPGFVARLAARLKHVPGASPPARLARKTHRMRLGVAAVVFLACAVVGVRLLPPAPTPPVIRVTAAPIAAQVAPPVAPLALGIVLDRSGSMDFRMGGQETKIDLARWAVNNALDALSAGDEFGLVTFNERADSVVPLQPVADDTRAGLRQSVNAVRAEGGTDIYAGLALMRDEMRRSSASVRHIVLMSDGESQGRSDYAPLLDELRAMGVTLSTVAIGTDADQRTMRSLATLTGGRFYYVADAADLPDLVRGDVRMVAGTPVTLVASPASTAPAFVCPVTQPPQPPLVPPPLSPPTDVGTTGFWYGNDALGLELQKDGTMLQNDIRYIWRLVPGQLRVDGRRLDGPAAPAGVSIPAGYSDLGGQAVRFAFPTTGCWEIVVRVSERELRFVVNVVPPPDYPATATAATAIAAASSTNTPTPPTSSPMGGVQRFRVAGTQGGGVRVRAETDTTAAVVAIAPEGTVIEITRPPITDRTGERWYPVKIGDKVGFVRAEYLVPA